MLTWFEVIGYTVLLEPDIAPGRPQAERYSYTDVILLDRLQQALSRINANIPLKAIEEAVCKVTCIDSLSLEENNCHFHKLLTDGVTVSYQVDDWKIYDKVQIIDLFNLRNNDWLVVHQFSVTDGNNIHSPRAVIFINGLPLAVIEWPNQADEKATLNEAYQQLQIYKQEIPKLFYYNQLLVISDGTQARVGTLTSDWEQFMPWLTIDGEDCSLMWADELEVLIQGIFDKRRFLDLVKNFISFERHEATIHKKMADYQQFYKVRSPLHWQHHSHPKERDMCCMKLMNNYTDQ